MECRYCGEEVKTGMKFCTRCGREIIWLQDDPLEMRELQDEAARKKSELQSYINEKKIYDNEIKQLEKVLTDKQQEASQLDGEICKIKNLRKFKKFVRPRERNAKIVISPTGKYIEKNNSKEPTFHMPYSLWDIVSVVVSILAIMCAFMPWFTIGAKEYNNISILKTLENTGKIAGYINYDIDVYAIAIVVGMIFGTMAVVFYGVHIYKVLTQQYETLNGVGAVAAFISVITEYVGIMNAKNAIEESIGSWISILSDYVIEIKSGMWMFLVCSIGVFIISIVKKQMKIQIIKEKPKPVEKQEVYMVSNYLPTLPIRVINVVLQGDKKDRITVDLVNYHQADLLGVILDVDIQDVFGDIFRITNCQFAQGMHYLSASAYHAERMEVLQLPWNGNLCGQIKAVRVYIKRLIYTEANIDCRKYYSMDIPDMKRQYVPYARKQWGDDALYEPQKTEEGWMCTCGSENSEYLNTCWLCKRKKGV